MAKQYPKTLGPYTCNGVELEWRDGDKNAVGICPFCEQPKFTIKLENGTGRCWSCSTGNEKGGLNPEIFVEKLYELFDRKTKDYAAIASERGLETETVMRWGMAWNYLLRCWTLPGYSAKGEIRQLYRLRFAKGKKRWWATTNLHHGIFGLNLWEKTKPIVAICEGAWDGMALWEVLRQCQSVEGRLRPTAAAENLLKIVNVVSIPGCLDFREQWIPLFGGKIVHLFFDNDWPRTNPEGKEIAGAARQGLERVSRMLSGSATPPLEIHYIKWGPDHYSKDLTSGFDVSDALREF